ncbi:hypothetical protein CVT24_009569 [Panaeolus cyanescens]|uniref:tRNA-splicing endonuclease subunit Sen34 n=1 Tax=Panaeolus cyanescens TaxID=181874 RepID=A0A409YAA2_9AGAR|nr:hypothetical protein CVT24_009569 [Panaeolus cyanescens]
MTTSLDDTGPIPLRVSNKIIIATLRSKYRICGVLSGTLPHLSQQNVFLGIPLVLTPEETVLLVNIGAAHLIDDHTAHSSPSSSQLTAWSNHQNQLIRAQLVAAESKLAEAAKAGGGRAMSEDAIRKRAAREEKKRKEREATAAAAGSDDLLHRAPSPTIATSVPAASTPASQPSTQETKSDTPYTIVVPASSREFEWYAPEEPSALSNEGPVVPLAYPKFVYTSIADAKAAGVWAYPSTPFEKARCGVFHDLWSKGYFMGGGIKFGGEYLVYPGDPLRYHSHFTATVIESPEALLRPMEIVAHGRLGTATKKAHLLCSWDDRKSKAEYLSIEWAGFG